MTIRTTGLRAVTAALGLLASVVVGLAVSPGTAHADCHGTTLVNSTLRTTGGFTYVSENPVSGTCNGNRYFQTWFSSSMQNWRASVHLQNNGHWEHHYGGYDTNWYYVDFADSNSHTLINLCLDNGSTWYCGWGTSMTVDTQWTDTYTDTNYGF